MCRAKIPSVIARVFFLALPLAVGVFSIPAWAGEKADAMAGAVLFRDKGCARCHGPHGEGTQKAPALVHIRDNKFWTPAKIKDQIMDGGAKMPPFSDAVTDTEIAQLIVLLRSKHWPVPPAAPASAN